MHPIILDLKQFIDRSLLLLFFLVEVKVNWIFPEKKDLYEFSFNPSKFVICDTMNLVETTLNFDLLLKLEKNN